MARKVFISVLGTGLYDKCKYTKDKIRFSSSETLFVQAATLEYLNVKSWDKNDLGLFLLTSKAKDSNWDKGINKRFDNRSKKDVDYNGLEMVIEELRLPITIYPLSILDGNNESEIWENFDRVFNELRDGDELYFDVTHAFRFLPMLILVLCNYAKFLRNITVKSITYGNYEAINTNVTPNEAPIIDLLALSQLQDWTYATRAYLESGNANELIKLSMEKNEDFSEALKVVVDDFHTCRSIPIVEGNHIDTLKQEVKKVKSDIPPLKNILTELEMQFSRFSVKNKGQHFITDENVKNGYLSAIWCFNNQLYQQAITIVQENLITEQCLIDGDKQDRYWKDGYGGQNITLNGFDKGQYRKSPRKQKTDKSERNYQDQYFYELVSINARNDFDHAGFTRGASYWNSKTIIDNLKIVFEKLIDKFFKNEKVMAMRNGFPYIDDLPKKHQQVQTQMPIVQPQPSNTIQTQTTKTLNYAPKIELKVLGKIDLDKLNYNKKRK